MNRTLPILLLLIASLLQSACRDYATRPAEINSTIVSTSHSIYIEGGVLKILSDGARNVLFVYIRPGVLDQWVATGGGGGVQNEPWLFSLTSSWTLGDANGRYSKGAPQKTFDFLFDSRNMTLTIGARTYAVRREDFIVMSLDTNWQASSITSGIDSLRQFNIPKDNMQHLQTEAQKYHTGF